MLVGREVECARIDRLLEEARGRKSAALVVRGEPGVGKSALLQFAAEHSGGLAVVRTRGIESELEIPFASMLDLLRPDFGRLDELPAAQAAALRGALALGPP
ncbi:MAG: AAA family ATPase, partial [Nitriliruptorales bacterium]